MGLDLRIVFLFLLFATGLLFFFRQGSFILRPIELRTMLLDVLLVPSALLTVAVFGFLLTRTDPMPLIREFAYQASLQQNVSFDHAIPDRLSESLDVVSVSRQDTDGDGENEWVVFYRYDLQSGPSPVSGAVFDYDRGTPPVIFPYRLRRAPNQDFLSENARSVGLSLEDITVDQNGPSNTNLEELVVSDSIQLTIFRFQQNSEPWDFPRDVPPRYQSIGYFYGSGGVSLDSTTPDKEVTVVDRERFDRAQLALRSVYGLNQATDSYWDAVYSGMLAPPIISTVDFFESPPQQILNTAYPEKIVLAFYASTCGRVDKTLCRHADANWNSADFLVEGDEAWGALTDAGGSPSYFGLNSFNNTGSLQVSNIRYYPTLESQSQRRVVTGSEPQLSAVDITFTANGETAEQTLRFQIEQVEGQWKIVKRLEFDSLALEQTPSEIQTSP